MKRMRMLWIASTLWALFWVYNGRQLFRAEWGQETSLLGLGGKFEHYLTAIGSLTVAVMPLSLTWLLRKFHKSREHGRLLKEKRRIEVRLKKLDEEKRKKAERKAAASPKTGEATA